MCTARKLDLIARWRRMTRRTSRVHVMTCTRRLRRLIARNVARNLLNRPAWENLPIVEGDPINAWRKQ